MKSKKTISLFLAAVMMMGATACDNTAQEETTQDETTTNETEETTMDAGEEETTPTVHVDPDLPKEFDAESIVFSFAAISDMHIEGSTTDTTAQKLESALVQLKEQAAIDDEDGLDAVFAVGDLINAGGYGGKYEQMENFKTVYEKVFSPTEMPMIFTPGNHDVAWTKDAVSAAENLNEILGEEYFLTDIDKEAFESEGNRHCVVDGFHVITLLPTGSEPVTYTEETKKWLDATLAEITEENPNQFVFVLTHPMIYDTVYGSDLGPLKYSGITNMWYTSDITNILSKYNQVVTFGGHLHFPLNDPRSIMQTAFTSLGCGSVRYMAIEAGNYEDMAGATTMLDKDEYSQGLLVQIDKNGNMRVTRMDFYHEETIGEDWTVSYPVSDGSHLTKYAKDRGDAENNTAPTLSTFDVTLGEVSGANQAVSVSFAAGTDDEFVHHYKIVITEKNGTVVATHNILADFYRHADPADMKQTWEKELAAIPRGGTYEVSLTAYDSWDAESNTLTKEITTADKEPENPVLPEAYVDFDFQDGAVTDTKGNVTVEIKGAMVDTVDVTAGEKSATMDALCVSESGEHVECTFNKLDTSDAFKAWAENGFSVEAFYVMGAKGSIQGVVCGTESGGWGVAEDKTGTPYFITGYGDNKYNKGAYATEVSSTTDLVHVVAVYNFESKLNQIYIDGVLASSSTIEDGFYPGKDEAFNKFCLGADFMSEARVSDSASLDFPSPDMVMVDAKIYAAALNSAQVQTAYNDAIESLG